MSSFFEKISFLAEKSGRFKIMNLKSEDRYTVWSPDHLNGCCLFGKDCCTQLAKYEDSGFTPEELQDIRDSILWSRAFSPRITRDRFEEIVQAESEGRLFVLPLKVGDIIWKCDYPPGCNRMIPIQKQIHNLEEIFSIMHDTDHKWFYTWSAANDYVTQLYK